MAHSSASCLFFLALCSSLLLYPDFARKERKHFFIEAMTSSSTTLAAVPATAPSPALSSEADAPAAGSLGMIVASQKGKSFTKHICELSSKPPVCSKILSGKDQKFMASLPRGTAAMLSIELSAAVAAKASLYMTDKLTSQGDHPTALISVLNGCMENYQDALVGFNGAYVNFTADPAMASESLSVAEATIGICEASLISGGQDSNLSRIDETNKLLRGLIQLVSKEMIQYKLTKLTKFRSYHGRVGSSWNGEFY